jgi:DNA-binding transcriptional LysR family regulator
MKQGSAQPRPTSPPQRIALADLLLTRSLLEETLHGKGAFGRAAARHHTHKPAVGDALRRVERVLGYRLLEGSSRRTSTATPAGAVFASRAAPLIDAWERLVGETYDPTG